MRWNPIPVWATAVRASGAGKQVVFTQFFKDGSSSEIESLKRLPGIRTIHADTVKGFYRAMTPEQRARAREDYTALFRQVTAASEKADLLILDEIVSACNRGVVPEALVTDFLRSKPSGLEVVLTGRNPAPAEIPRRLFWSWRTISRKCASSVTPLTGGSRHGRGSSSDA